MKIEFVKKEFKKHVNFINICGIFAMHFIILFLIISSFIMWSSELSTILGETFSPSLKEILFISIQFAIVFSVFTTLYCLNINKWLKIIFKIECSLCYSHYYEETGDIRIFKKLENKIPTSICNRCEEEIKERKLEKEEKK